MKRSSPLTIQQILDQVLDRSNIREQVLAHRASYLWGEVVGTGINQYTLRRFVKGRTLYVTLSSAPLKTELQFQKTQLIAAINSAVGSDVIDNIVFS